MRIRLWLILLTMVSASVTNAALPKPSKPDDFAYGLRLQVEGQSALWQLPLPAAVYSHVTRADLGDVRIFNALGQTVSYALHRPVASLQPAPATIALPFFPLHVLRPEGGHAQTLKVRRDPQGRVLDITSNVKPVTPSTQISAYLIDVSHLKGTLASLTINWQREHKQGFSTTVRLEHSQDLVDWQPLVPKAVLADLQSGSYNLAHRDIAVPTSHAAYLRLAWPKALRHVRLTTVQGRLRQRQLPPLHHWTRVAGVVDPSKAHTYHFDTGGYWPVDRLRVEFDEPNMVADVRLQSRPAHEATWQQRFRALVYQLQTADTSVQSKPLVLPVTSDRHWRLQIVADAQTATDRQPTLAFGWIPHTLTFVAQGAPPYTLAYGSARAAPSERPVATLLKKIGKAEAASLIKPAQAGDAFTLGGADRLLPPPAPLPWKQIVLWSVLLTGAMVLAYMVQRLYHQLNTAVPNTGENETGSTV
jgi:hypothetical protein